MTRVRNRVREWRLRSLLRSQRELSRRTGIRPSTLSKIENNQVTLSIQNAISIAQALNRPLDELYEIPVRSDAAISSSRPDEARLP